MFSNICKVATAAVLLTSTPVLADWSTTVISHGHTGAGATGLVECQPGGTPGSIWGTGTYTSDSSICGAAQHFGWIPPGTGGSVTYRTVPGLGAYIGSSQNGVTTSDYGAWDLAFQITGITPQSGGSGVVTETIPWGASADSLGIASNVGESYLYTCAPYDDTTLNVWGTRSYTSDSSVCGAAAHYGVLLADTGGTFRVQVTGEQTGYAGTSANGINTSSYGAWPRSFTFY